MALIPPHGGTLVNRIASETEAAALKKEAEGLTAVVLSAREQCDLEMIATGPVGKPTPPARSGLRIVTVSATGVTHKYYDFGELP